MFDYEIKGYTVYWTEVGAVVEFSSKFCEFGTEEEAIAFIKERRTHWWTDYRIEQTRCAVIDCDL